MNFKSFSLLALLLLAPACSKNGWHSRPVQLRLALPGPETKVTMGEEQSGTFPLLWQEGDRVSLNGCLSNPMSKSLSGKSHAAFSFADFSGSAPYNLLYPGAASGQVNLDGKTIALYSSADNLDQVFCMHHLCCGVRLSLTGDLTLASLSLSAPGGEKISGRFTPSFTDGSLSEVSANQSLTLDLETPVALSDTPLSFYLFFAPGTFSGGLSLKALNPGGTITREWRFATGRTLEKGKLYLLPETAFTSRDWNDGCIVSLEGLTEDAISFEL